jgi:Zn-dependent protease
MDFKSARNRLWGIRWLRWGIILILFIVSALTYPILFGLSGISFGLGGWVAVGFGLALLVMGHEWFHLRAMREYDIEAIGPIPIPLLGAWVDTKEPFPTLWAKFAVVLRGPLAAVFSAPIFAVGWAFKFPPLIALAIFWWLINALNLIPIFPLDGGLAVAAILGSISVRLANAFVILSLIVPLAAAVLWHPVFAVISALAVLELFLGWRKRRRSPAAVAVSMTGRQVAVAVGSYLGAVAVVIGIPIWILISLGLI